MVRREIDESMRLFGKMKNRMTLNENEDGVNQKSKVLFIEGNVEWMTLWTAAPR